MLKVVLDTNIIISAALSLNGNPSKIVEILENNDDIKFYYTTNILVEYKRVLSYEKLNISIEKQERAINLIKKAGILIEPSKSKIPLPDESDRIFYDTAKAANAYLITGNLKHYPEESHILTPMQFIEIFTK